MPVTVRKKKLTVKTIRAQRGPQPVENAPLDGDGSSMEASQPVITKKPASYTLAGILALLAAGCFIALLILQYLEWSYYHQPRSAFPLPPQLAEVSAPVAEPAPVATDTADVMP